MWRLNGNTVRVLYASIAIGLVVVALLTYMIARDMKDSAVTGVRYDGDVYVPIETGPFCPGDVLTYDLTSFRDRIAPMDVIGNWCNVDTAICLADETLDYSIAIFDLREPVTRTRAITIPDNPRMFPGDWLYVHQIAVANTDRWQTYVVPFTIREGCTP